MASIIKRKGRQDWYACYYVNGKLIRKSTGVKLKEAGYTAAQLKKLAQTQAERMEALARGDVLLDKQIDALRAAADAAGNGKVPSLVEYLNKFKISGGEQNRSNVIRAFKLFLNFLGADSLKRLDRITREMCQKFIDYQASRVSAGTVRRYKCSIACAFNAAIQEGFITRSPLSGIKLPKDRPMKRELFTHEEVRKMLTEFPLTWRDMVLICLGTAGQRIGDCACLKWEHIDFERGVISFDTQKTGYGVEVPMLPQLAARLREIQEIQEGSEIYVLPEMANKYLRSKGYLSSEFITLLKGLGIASNQKVKVSNGQRNVSTKSFHGLRNYAVTTLRDAGVGEDMTCALVGHENIQQDRAYYRTNIRKKQAAMQKFGNVLFADYGSSESYASAREA